MKLSPKIYELIAVAELKPEVSNAKIAKMLRTKSSTIQYHLKRLVDDGTFRLRAFVNPFALGYSPYVMFFSCQATTPTAISKLIKNLSNHPRVVWIGSLAGEFQFGLTLLSRSEAELREILFDIAKDGDALFTSKVIAPRFKVDVFNRTYLTETKVDRVSLTVMESHSVEKIDLLDHQILTFTANGPFQSIRGLARELSAPFSTVERRIKSLREKGIIKGFSYSVDIDRLQVLSYRLLIKTSNLNLKLSRALTAFATKTPGAIRLLDGLGPFDFELDVEVKTASEISQMTQDLLALGSGQIQGIQVLQEIEDFRFTSYPFKNIP